MRRPHVFTKRKRMLFFFIYFFFFRSKDPLCRLKVKIILLQILHKKKPFTNIYAIIIHYFFRRLSWSIFSRFFFFIYIIIKNRIFVVFCRNGYLRYIFEVNNMLNNTQYVQLTSNNQTLICIRVYFKYIIKNIL